jgi:hypothetical protein
MAVLMIGALIIRLGGPASHKGDVNEQDLPRLPRGFPACNAWTAQQSDHAPRASSARPETLLMKSSQSPQNGGEPQDIP